ncbi:putative nodulin homeobox protein [Helianthus annuus]|nr:putative nodulin homeobox protein [Helianthus annuus]KAJ0808326.1 putative nodulin homeobox protein [Helianthus annuus]KAJ0946304.1 putative nodulin homeobox protein [Helianthus annuus]KAJ0955390.1 putative nodulin homeobox protein [Helianthus annuus]KAJ0955391.1 putative nodulin homeobox protein [Helianthus annuus]
MDSDGDDGVTENQTGSNPTFEPKVGQHVIFTNAKGEEIGRGKIHKTKGVWFEKDLEELKLCVLDVTDLEVWDCSQLPHPTDIMTTFLQAKVILGKTRIMWDSSRLILISQ